MPVPGRWLCLPMAPDPDSVAQAAVQVWAKEAGSAAGWRARVRALQRKEQAGDQIRWPLLESRRTPEAAVLEREESPSLRCQVFRFTEGATSLLCRVSEPMGTAQLPVAGPQWPKITSGRTSQSWARRAQAGP